MGTRTEGPLSLAEVRARATRGSISRMHMVSRDRSRWVVASKVSSIFRADGSVCTDLLGTTSDAPFMLDMHNMDDEGDSAAPFLVEIPGRRMVRAQWILVPAWAVIATAALMPTARHAGSALRPWDVIELVEAHGWRGALLGSLWMLLLCLAGVAIGLGTLSNGSTRAIGGLIVGSLAVLISTVAVWAGQASGFVAGTTLLVTLCAVRVLDAILYGPSSRSTSAHQPAITLAETAIGLSLAVVAVLISIVGLIVKGIPFIPSAFFGLIACGTCAVACVFSGGESPRRVAIIWLSVVTLAAVVCAVLAESITAHLLGAHRMAVFEGIRALCISALASICASVSYCELRFIQPPKPPAPTERALIIEEPAI